MSDMPNDFWAGWIVVLTITSLVGLAWLTYSVYFTPKSAEEETGGPVWDGNLREGANPAPMWWFWLLLALLVTSVGYLMLYPGLGSFSGALQWSQGGRLDDSLAAYQARFGDDRQAIATLPLAELREDSTLMRSAQRVYDRNCAVCHGADAKGVAGHFPNLVDDAWQWGGDPAQIEQTIRNGRTAIMVGWAAALGEQGVRDVAAYTKGLAGGVADDHPGKVGYDRFCVACHGADGAGNPLLGAPSLADEVWLYGSDINAIVRSIAEGRNGQMPPFGERLDDTQVRLLVALLTPGGNG